MRIYYAAELKALAGGPPNYLTSDRMKDSTKELHHSLIRSVKGIIAAWEKWLKSQEENPNEGR